MLELEEFLPDRVDVKRWSGGKLNVCVLQHVLIGVLAIRIFFTTSILSERSLKAKKIRYFGQPDFDQIFEARRSREKDGRREREAEICSPPLPHPLYAYYTIQVPSTFLAKKI